MKKRDVYVKIWRELAADKSMVFLAGPRQVGKTTLSEIISHSFQNSLYLNWDIVEHRARLIENPTFFEVIDRKDLTAPLVVFDEIHKYKDWKNYLKGVYDQFHGDYQFLVSGSGRLDIYQKGGDSLAGRYLLFHLWPFTIAELVERAVSFEGFLADPLKISMDRSDELKSIWRQLSSLSGFPEPFLASSEKTYRRWTNTYSKQVIREDIRDLTGIKSVGNIETLFFLLPSKVGSPLSVPSLARDLRVSYNSVHNWLDVFERFFLIFSIYPWTKKISRAIQKERKVYLFDIPRVKEPAPRLENMVAVELWRAVNVWNDLGYGRFSLHFIKNKEQQEVDFLIANDHEPLLLIEVKLSDMEPSVAIKKFQSALKINAVQLVNESDTFRIFSHEGCSILVAPAYQWLSQLP